MKKFLIAMFAAMIAMSANAQVNSKKVYDESIDPMEQIDKAVVRAGQEGKFVICQVGGNWCSWCLRFADFITSDSTISKVIEDNYVYIHVNYSPRRSAGAGDAEKDAALMQRLGNPGRFGYPVLVVLDSEGNVMHIQDSVFLEEGSGYNQKKVLRFFNSWTPKTVEG